MPTRDELAERIRGILDLLRKEGDFVGEGQADMLIDLVESALDERDVLCGMVHQLTNELIDQRARSLGDERRRVG